LLLKWIVGKLSTSKKSAVRRWWSRGSQALSTLVAWIVASNPHRVGSSPSSWIAASTCLKWPCTREIP